MEDMAALDIALDSVGLDELNSLEAKTLLDTIDSLRELHVGEIVNLPQIIVVGDQSSGKSSVLEAISRVRFPTKGDLCTRFATELVLRQSPETKIGVRIDGATGTGSVSSQQFRRVSFDKDALPEIINEATEKMGIRVGGSKRFSKDILHVEIAGPDIYPVTLVDLPGFFHSETADQTWEDKQLVKELAESYMKQSKSIILAVVSANQNLANQIVVEEAKRFDPNRERTLGIITKPDLTAPGSQDEKKCLQLIKGQESKHKLKLGWYVLRNRPEGQENTTADDRDAEEEKFFQSGAWAGIIPTNRGITSLRKRLSKVLLEHIQKTLPGLIEEIESSLSARQRTLEQLGKPRSEPDELRTYLLEIAERFQRLARDGIDGRYVDDFFGDLYSHQGTRKLRALLRGFNRALHATLVSKGVDREIDWDDEEDSPFRDGGFWWLRKGYDAPEYLKPFLDLFKSFSNPTRISERELCKELEELAAANQGIEYPGLPNGSLGVQLFKMQIKPWRGIAEFYLDQVLDFAKAFVEDLFTHIIGADRQTINAVLVFYVGTFFEERRKLLKEKLQEILRPYDSAYGPPLDAEFHETLSRRAARREAGRVASWLEEEFPAAFADKSAKGLTHGEVKTAALFSGAAKASEFGTEKVIGMTMTHFQMSLRTFAENVVNLAAENCLISDLPTILTPSMVVRMNPERLVELAQESESVQAQRLECQHEASILRKGLEKCQKSRLHERTVLPRSFLNTPPSNSGSRSASSTETPNPGSTHPKESARPKSIFAEQSSSAGPSKSSTQNLFAVPTSKTTPFGSFTSSQPSPAASSSAPQSGGLFSGSGQSSFSSRAPGDSSSLFNTGRDTARNGTPTQAPGPSLFDKSTPITNGAGTGSSLFSNPPAQTSLFKSSTSNNTQSGGFGSGR